MEAHQCALVHLANQQEQLAFCQKQIHSLKEELKGAHALEEESQALESSSSSQS